MQSKKKKKLMSHQKLIAACIVVIIGIVVMTIYSRSNTTVIDTNVKTEGSQTVSHFTHITPTIIHTTSNKTKFIHPQNNFSFEYPSDWIVNVQKHIKSDDWYDVTLTHAKEKDIFRIHFMHQGRGAPYYEYETTEEKFINNRQVIWKTMYKNDTAFEAVASFPNNDFGHDLIGLYIYLPQENQEEFMKQVEEIIATLE